MTHTGHRYRHWRNGRWETRSGRPTDPPRSGDFVYVHDHGMVVPDGVHIHRLTLERGGSVAVTPTQLRIGVVTLGPHPSA